MLINRIQLIVLRFSVWFFKALAWYSILAVTLSSQTKCNRTGNTQLNT